MTSTLICANNLERRIITGFTPPEDFDEGEDPGNYYLSIAYFDFSHPKKKFGLTTIDIMKSEIHHHLEDFLKYAVFYNPNFIFERDDETHAAAFGDAFYEDTPAVELPEDPGKSADMMNAVFLRRGGYASERELLRDVKSAFSNPFFLMYDKFSMSCSKRFQLTVECFRREAIKGAVPLDVPISELRRDVSDRITTILVSEKDLGLTGYGHSLE